MLSDSFGYSTFDLVAEQKERQSSVKMVKSSTTEEPLKTSPQIFRPPNRPQPTTAKAAGDNDGLDELTNRVLSSQRLGTVVVTPGDTATTAESSTKESDEVERTTIPNPTQADEPINEEYLTKEAPTPAPVPSPAAKFDEQSAIVIEKDEEPTALELMIEEFDEEQQAAKAN